MPAFLVSPQVLRGEIGKEDWKATFILCGGGSSLNNPWEWSSLFLFNSPVGFLLPLGSPESTGVQLNLDIF